MTERTIFLAALDITDPAERAAYLDRVCRDDPDLRQRVERLLEAHAAADNFLAARPPAGPAPPAPRGEGTPETGVAGQQSVGEQKPEPD